MHTIKRQKDPYKPKLITNKQEFYSRIRNYLDELDNKILVLKRIVTNVSEQEKWDIWQQIENIKKKRVGLSLMFDKITTAKDRKWTTLKYDLIQKYPELK